MSGLSMEKAREIVAKHETEDHLLKHALAVSAAMGAMAEHFGADKEYWQAIGYLHDVDFEKYPQEHCHHVRELLAPEGLYTVDELTGIVMATALMRPTGISDLEPKSVNKKFKDKRFAAKCDREVIKKGAEMLGMELNQIIALTIEGMKAEMVNLGLGPRE